MIQLPCPSTYECVTTEKQLRQWAKKLDGVKAFAFDTETSSTDSMTCTLRGVSLGYLDENHDPHGCYIPLTHRTKKPQLPRDVVYKALAPHLANKRKRKVFQNAVYDVVVLARHDCPPIVNVHDTMQMSYVLTAKKDMFGHGMDHLAKAYLDYETIRFDDVVLAELGMEEFGDVGLPEATAYAAEDSAVTIAMDDVFVRKLKEEGLWELYLEDRKLTPVVARMKLNGVAVDDKKLYDLTQQWMAARAKAERKVTKIAGREINLASPKKVSEYLFDELKLPSHKETDAGGESSDKEALELIKDEHKVVPYIIEVKKLDKLISSFGASLIQKAHPETGLIHCNYNLTATSTGRLSCSEPNLQQIPIRSEEGAAIRDAFVARAVDRMFGSFDYSQVEVRILAHVTGDRNLIAAFERGDDAHAVTAAMMWGRDPEYYADKSNPDAEFKRRAAKTITFGIIYGITEWGLSRQLRVDPVEALEFIERYFERMPSVGEYKEAVIAFAKEHKYSETLFGRRIHVPMINWSGGIGRGQDRLAVNGTIQGTSADLTRRAMVRVAHAIEEADLDCLMTLTVHDELAFDADKRIAKRAAKLIQRTMETAGDDVIDWRVPIVVEGKFGNSWKEAH